MLACIFTSIWVVFIEVSPDSILKTTNTMTGTFTLDFLYSSTTIPPLANGRGTRRIWTIWPLLKNVICGLIKSRICAILLTGEAWVTFALNQSHNGEKELCWMFDSWIVLDIK